MAEANENKRLIGLGVLLTQYLFLFVSTLMMKIFQTQRWEFMPTSKVPNVKTFQNPGDLKTKVKVMRHAIKSLVIMHLGCKFQVRTDLWTIVCPIGYNGKVEL